MGWLNPNSLTRTQNGTNGNKVHPAKTGNVEKGTLQCQSKEKVDGGAPFPVVRHDDGTSYARHGPPRPASRCMGRLRFIIYKAENRDIVTGVRFD